MTDNLWPSENKNEKSRVVVYLYKRGVFLSLASSEQEKITVKLIKSDVALHILTMGMLTTKSLCASLYSFSQSAFVTCWERGNGRVRRRL